MCHLAGIQKEMEKGSLNMQNYFHSINKNYFPYVWGFWQWKEENI